MENLTALVEWMKKDDWLKDEWWKDAKFPKPLFERMIMEVTEANPQKEVDVLTLMRRWDKALSKLTFANVKLVLDYLNSKHLDPPA